MTIADFLTNLYVIMNLYKLTANKTTQTSQNYITSSEWMSKILYNDSIVVLSSVLRLLMVSLVTPENLITTLDETTEDDDMNKYEKIKASDCVRRVLTKKYNTVNSYLILEQRVFQINHQLEI